MTRRIALAGWFGSDNLGDELILRALIVALRARGAEPVAVSIDPKHTRRHHGISSISHRHPQQFPALVRALRGVDGLAIAGGIVQSETSPWNIPFHMSRLQAAAVARCPASAVGIGVGQVRGAPGRALALRTLRRLRSIAVRDVNSAERLREWGLHGAAVGADPVAAMEPVRLDPQDTMCVILRPPNRRGPGTYASKASRAVSKWGSGLARAAQAIEAVSRATGLKPRLTAFEASFDESLHMAVADRLTIPVEMVSPTVDTVLSEVGRSRLVITMRYHGAIAALLHERPAVLLDYSPKMSSLAAEGPGWARVVNPHRFDSVEMVRAVSSAFDISVQAPEALAALRARLAVNRAELDALVEGRP